MRRIAVLCVAALALSMGTAPAETVRLGVSHLASCSIVAIALAKGYFTAEGLEPKLSFFDAQQPIAVALTSGDLDFGVAAQTTALYSLAAGGKLKIVGGGAGEAPGFHYLGLYASNAAYANGLTSPRGLAGHSFALTQMGSGLEFILSEYARKYGFDFKAVRILALQSNGNIATALAGGRVDAAIFNPQGAAPLVAKGDVKFLGWVGDQVELSTAYLYLAATRMTVEHPDTVRRVLAALRKGAEDYTAAFGHDKRADGPAAPAILSILATYLGQPVDMVKEALPYFDPEARVDMAYLQRQIDWDRAEGFLKADVTAAAIVDRRFVIPRGGAAH